MGSKRVLLFVPKTIEDNRLPWLRQGSFLKKYNMVQRFALATTGFLSLEEYNMLQKITMATTGFLSFTTPCLESSKGCGTRGHLTLVLVAIYSKVKGKLVLCVLGKFDRVPEPLEPGLNPPLVSDAHPPKSVLVKLKETSLKKVGIVAFYKLDKPVPWIPELH